MTRALLLAAVAFVAALPAPVHAQGPPVRIGSTVSGARISRVAHPSNVATSRYTAQAPVSIAVGRDR